MGDIENRVSAEIGRKYGSLTVTGFAFMRRRVYVSCLCDCGRETTGSLNNLKSGSLKSCGCLRTRKLDPGSAGLIKIYRAYIRSAKKEGRKFELGMEEFKELTSAACAYCGTVPLRASATTRSNKAEVIEYTTYKYNGVDRVDSGKGYEKGNVVPCCTWCNIIKRERSVEELKSHVARIHGHHNRPLK